MVGDRMETDMVMGIRAGMGTALVLTGVTTREQAEMSSTGPDLILETLEDLIPAISR
jgi:ribonucleotide monophosphatase NagD (HAD superfamily)